MAEMSLQSINVAVPHTLSVREVSNRLKRMEVSHSLTLKSFGPIPFTLGTAIGDINGKVTVTDSEVRIDTDQMPMALWPADWPIEAAIKGKLTEALKP